eukprot:TRINITY_DN3814_c0_g1_i2.p2 TRINITY_DN3814_c0_g1~~TRINITY_DN3814_c0_g1_i2.p2  ORF type:complete len:201 (-),score=60.32 TRINITY_DN3814_c0_g1_i2:194-796(-)
MAGLYAMSSFGQGLRKKVEHPKLVAQAQKLDHYYVTYQEVHELVGRSAASVAERFRPECILAVGGGGYIPARIMRTFLPTVPLIAVTVNFYNDEKLEVRDEPFVVQWVDQATVDRCIRGKRVLVVDDVDDTRNTLAKLLPDLQRLGPADIGVFVLHSKVRREKAIELPADRLFIGQECGDRWIEYPWDAKDISAHYQARR